MNEPSQRPIRTINLDFEPTVVGVVEFLQTEFAEKVSETFAEKKKSQAFNLEYLKIHFDASELWEISDEIADKVKDGLPLSEQEKSLLYAHLKLGENYKVKKKRGRQSDTSHFFLFLIVFFLAEKGISPFRNETSEPNSGCDIAAGVCRHFGWSPTSYSGVKKVFLDKRREWMKPKMD